MERGRKGWRKGGNEKGKGRREGRVKSSTLMKKESRVPQQQLVT